MRQHADTLSLYIYTENKTNAHSAWSKSLLCYFSDRCKTILALNEVYAVLSVSKQHFSTQRIAHFTPYEYWNICRSLLSISELRKSKQEKDLTAKNIFRRSNETGRSRLLSGTNPFKSFKWHITSPWHFSFPQTFKEFMGTSKSPLNGRITHFYKSRWCHSNTRLDHNGHILINNVNFLFHDCFQKYWILKLYCFYCIFYQINVAFMNIRE